MLRCTKAAWHTCQLRTLMDKHEVNCTRFVHISRKEMGWSRKNPFMKG